MWPVRCSSTWRSVSTTKPRLTRSPASARGDADRERARVPQRIEQRRAVVRARRAAPASTRDDPPPRARPRAKRALDRGIARDQRLRRVERLRADFAGVVDAHQPRGVAALVRRRASASGRSRAGHRARRRRDAGQRAQRAVEADDQRVEHRDGIAAMRSCAQRDARRTDQPAKKTGARRRPFDCLLPRDCGDARLLLRRSGRCRATRPCGLPFAPSGSRVGRRRG